VTRGVYIYTAGDQVDLMKLAGAVSELLSEAFGEDKMPSRLVIGVDSLRLGPPVELESTFEVSLWRKAIGESDENTDDPDIP
jgi:hypothetical protein